MTLILCCGYKRSGKDTLYSYLQANSTELWDVYCKSGSGNRYFELFQMMDKCETSTAVIKEFYENSNIEISDINKELYRPQLIKLAEERKVADKYYWIRKCLISQGSRYISGFRFPFEYDFARENHNNILTVRVFRKEIPIPDELEEHQLDAFATDFLFLGKGTSLDDISNILPLYREYRRII